MSCSSRGFGASRRSATSAGLGLMVRDRAAFGEVVDLLRDLVQPLVQLLDLGLRRNTKDVVDLRASFLDARADVLVAALRALVEVAVLDPLLHLLGALAHFALHAGALVVEAFAQVLELLVQ